MSYIYDRKTKSGIYRYQCESYRDKETKKVITKQTLLGKVDPTTNELIYNEANDDIVNFKDYGDYLIFQKAIENNNLKTILETVFPEDYLDILTCSSFLTFNDRALSKCKAYTETAVTFSNRILSSQYTSKLLKRITSNKRYEFFNQWSKSQIQDSYYALDITSISSYSEMITYFEWGHNRDNELLPQINLMYLVGEKDSTPIYYQEFSGSIVDSRTLSNFIAHAKEIGVNNIKLVMDKGFYSASNIKTLYESDTLFCIAIPFTNNFPKSIIDQVRSSLITESKYIYDHECYGDVFEYKNNGRTVNIHIFFDEVLCSQQKRTFFEQVRKAENTLGDLRERLFKDIKLLEKKFKNHDNKDFINQKNELVKQLFRQIKKHETVFDIQYLNDTFTFNKSESKINELLKYKGYVTIITNDFSKNTSDIISIYRNKDVVEKKFDDVKNSLDCSRLGVHSDEAMNGKLFLIFISTIILNYIRGIIKKNEKLDKYSPETLLTEVKKLKIAEFKSGKKKLNVITSKQLVIFSAFGLSESAIIKGTQ